MTITLRQAERRIIDLETAIKALQQQAPPPGGGVQWRAPQIKLIQEPAELSKTTSGTIAWQWVGTGAVPIIKYSLNGETKKTAPQSFSWGPLKAGLQRVDFYVGAEPELTKTWTIET